MLTRAFALLAILSIPAGAGVTLVLTPNLEIGMPGDEVTFQGNFGVDSGDPDTFFNDLDFSLIPPADGFLTPDKNIFFVNAPGSLCNNDPSCAGFTQYTGPIFGVQIAPGTPFGDYFGTVTMLGGVGDANSANTDPLTTPVGFEVDVVSPEPGTLPMIIPILMAGLAVLRKKPATH
jgi:hypothetical protein